MPDEVLVDDLTPPADLAECGILQWLRRDWYMSLPPNWVNQLKILSLFQLHYQRDDVCCFMLKCLTAKMM